MSQKKTNLPEKIMLILLLTLSICSYSVGLRIALVRGNSMQPAYHDGEIVIGVTVKDASSLGRGDVVTFYPPTSEQIVYIKRIVGLPGETVEARGGLLFINGISDGISQPGMGTWGPVEIDDGCIFLLGDNRSRSNDSHVFGPVPIERVLTRVVT